MTFCEKCGAKMSRGAKFCAGCGIEVIQGSKNKSSEKNSEEKEKPIQKVVEKRVEIHHEPKRSSRGFLAFLLFVAIVVTIVYVAIDSGILDEFTQSSGVAYVDPCERQLNQCNHGCGEGIFNSICKEKCSYDYRKCRG